MRVVVAPGQGSQSQGFLAAWIEGVAGFREILEQYSEFSSQDLVTLGTTGTEEQIKDTAIAQPLIVAAALASYRTMFSDVKVDAVAGHSVGEFAAAALAGVLTDEDALRLVAIRAQAMAKAASEAETSMAAILGGDQESVLEAIANHDLHAANYNGAGQIVAAGAKAGITALIASPPEKARVIELKVAGAFHTSYMESAKAELQKAAAALSPKDPNMPLYSNQAGQLVSSGQEFLDLLVSQVTNPVRWDLVMDNFKDKNAEVIELLPAGALSGLFKRAVEDCRTVALKSPGDFEKVER